VLEFRGILGYPEAEYVLVDLTIEGVYFGQGILTREVWGKLKLLKRPVMRLPDSIIKVMEKGNSEERISLANKVKDYDPGSQERGPGRPQTSSLSAPEESPAQPGSRDGLIEKA
jgi:hypothetical protein